MKTKLITAKAGLDNETLKSWGIKRKPYKLLKSFFYNGEGHYRVELNGKVEELPDCFFEDVGAE